MPAPVVTIGLLPLSNVVMTSAWHGRLRLKAAPLLLVALASRSLAVLEHVLQVPADRWGSGRFGAARLKTVQEGPTLAVSAVVSVLCLHEPLGWNHALGFGPVARGAFFIVPSRG